MTHLLDTAPFDWSRPEAARLKVVLIAAYPNAESAGILLDHIGFPRTNIAWTDAPMSVVWHRIITGVSAAKKLRPLVELALGDDDIAAWRDELRRLSAGRSASELETLGRALAVPCAPAEVSMLESAARAAAAVGWVACGSLRRTGVLISDKHVVTVREVVAASEYPAKAITVSFDGDVQSVAAPLDGDDEGAWVILELATSPTAFGIPPAALPDEPDLSRGNRAYRVFYDDDGVKKLDLHSVFVVDATPSRVQLMSGHLTGLSGSAIFGTQWELGAIQVTEEPYHVAGTTIEAVTGLGVPVERLTASLGALGVSVAVPKGARTTAAPPGSAQGARALDEGQERVMTRIRSRHHGYARGRLWPVGATVRVGFLDGPREIFARVAEIAKEWEQHANIQLEFGSVDVAAVRVTFESAGSWSYIGTDCLAVPQHEPTMGLAAVLGADAHFVRGTVLHEFGHVLGLLHEHQHPANDIPWHVERARAALGGPPNHWPAETVDTMLFHKWDPDVYLVQKPFDAHSIMMYRLESDWLSREYDHGSRGELSEGDNAFVAQLYPPPGEG